MSDNLKRFLGYTMKTLNTVAGYNGVFFGNGEIEEVTAEYNESNGKCFQALIEAEAGERKVVCGRTVQMGAGLRHTSKIRFVPREEMHLGILLKCKESEKKRLVNLRIANRKALLTKMGDLTEMEKAVIAELETHNQEDDERVVESEKLMRFYEDRI